MANTAHGSGALASLTTGDGTCAFGEDAGDAITTADDNVVIGGNADVVDTATTQSVIIGDQAKGAARCVCIGYLVGSNMTATATDCVAVGAYTLDDAATGTFNTAVGQGPLSALTSGARNTAVGRHAAINETTADDITCVGTFTGDTAGPSKRTCIGVFADGMCSIGESAMAGCAVDNQNVGLGANTFPASFTGSDCTMFGYISVPNATTGVNGTVIGETNTTFDNGTIIGNNITQTTASATDIGAEAASYIHCEASCTNVNGLMTSADQVELGTGNQTPTAAQVKPGTILRCTATAGDTWTLPTGAALDSYFEHEQTDMGWLIYVRNEDAANTVTMAGNTGTTIDGTTTVAAQNCRIYLAHRTGAATYVFRNQGVAGI